MYIKNYPHSSSHCSKSPWGNRSTYTGYTRYRKHLPVRLISPASKCVSSTEVIQMSFSISIAFYRHRSFCFLARYSSQRESRESVTTGTENGRPFLSRSRYSRAELPPHAFCHFCELTRTLDVFCVCHRSPYAGSVVTTGSAF